MVIAFLMITTQIGFEEEAVKEILDIEGVIEAHPVQGDYDIVCKIEKSSLRVIKKVIDNIRELNTVRSTMTMIVEEGTI